TPFPHIDWLLINHIMSPAISNIVFALHMKTSSHALQPHVVDHEVAVSWHCLNIVENAWLVHSTLIRYQAQLRLGRFLWMNVDVLGLRALVVSHTFIIACLSKPCRV